MSVSDESEFHPDFFAEVPKSKGIPKPVNVLIVVGLIGIFLYGGSVVFLASYGHLWPTAKTLRIDLSGK